MAMIFQRALERILSPACVLAALAAPAAVSSLEWDFAKTAEDRAFVDVKPTPSRPGVPAGAIALDIKLFEGAASVRAATFHLKIGGDWIAAAQVDSAALATSRLRVPFGNFVPSIGEEPKIDEVRVSVWRSPSSGAGRLVVGALSLAPVSEIAVLSGLAGSWMETLARRVAATLSRGRLDCDLHPSVSAAVKSAPRLVIVPDASSLPANDAELLAGFIRKGGRAIVYYSANPVLSEAFGLRPVPGTADSRGAPSSPSTRPFRHIPTAPTTPSCRSSTARLPPMWWPGSSLQTARPFRRQ